MESERVSADRVQLALATAVPDKYLKIALTTYQNGRMDGLCHDGAWECALDTIRSLNTDTLINKQDRGT